ncbi:dihydroneopterin aldolase,Dihydroneopterin aldolase [Chlamydia poikilotherma]|uniref:7,8-dihydroneopterin aldolase n=1 Tax=Chlamydia poikilotherma TaxID=1967783 RepID=A0A3B0PQT8_9CHLA|nr:dihydroneopterin aldolase,Dihydroneopterin aldolase [Chlamydia poikilotherma]
MRLGCSLEERHFKQPILVSIVLSFFEEPSVCVSDDLNDACCYIEITSLIEEVASSKPCALVEHLSKLLMDALESKLKNKVSKIDLEVHKERPPVPNLLKPICFKISRKISL